MISISDFYKTMEGEVVKALLSNDKQYFTTEEYDIGVEKWIFEHYGYIRGTEEPPPIEIRRRQLEACELLCEISQDVWVFGCLAVNQNEQTNQFKSCHVRLDGPTHYKCS